MKKYIPLIFLLLLSTVLSSQELTEQAIEIEVSEQTEPRSDSPPNDGQASFGQSFNQETEEASVSLPQSLPFNSGESIEGLIQGSINEVTGKVAFSVPISSISARTLSYAISLNYSNQGIFKKAKQNSHFSETSSLGFGWQISIPKIVVDNKQTGTREDDDFYLIDGSNSTKLICTNRDGSYWEFEAEKYAPWKFHFYPSTSYNDYWIITKEDGSTFHFGDPDIFTGVPRPNKAREFIVRWGNWIGNSKESGENTQQTLVWNLYKIEDQWDNEIEFFYDRIDDLSVYPRRQHTEASYLSKITSTNGSNIRFNYANKDNFEYHEPHTEGFEPDAYQERYEKKYLTNIETYNTENALLNTYLLAYDIPFESPSIKRKRYLTSVTQRNGSGETLPAQSFEYYTTGTYKGGLKKVSYPMGGSVTYNYQNQEIFTNGPNRFAGSEPDNSADFYYHAAYVRDNYVLKLYRSKTVYSGQKHQFKIVRHWWNGTEWESDNYLIPVSAKVNNYGQLENMQAIFKEDFYGVMVYDDERAYVYLWHLHKDGRTWVPYRHSYLYVGPGRPQFLAGDNFTAIGSKHDGKLYTYCWNGSNWNFKQINQGTGHFNYGATNNYILSLDVDGGPDMVTNINYPDNYYIHYLDAEKRWTTKSWTHQALQHISPIGDPSYFYPSRSQAGFVADNNPEFFLRWDVNYNLQHVDNVIGAYDDRHPFQPVTGNMFALTNWLYKTPIKAARYNGINWSVRDFSTEQPFMTFFAEDLIATREDNGLQRHFYTRYDPNHNTWIKHFLTPSTLNHPYTVTAHTGVTPNFMVSGNALYKRSSYGQFTYDRDLHSSFHNDLTMTNSINHAFVELAEHRRPLGVVSITFQESRLYYQNKETGNIDEIDMGTLSHTSGSVDFGGYYSSMSNKSLWLRNNHDQYQFSTFLYRMIDDKVNNTIKNVIVDNIVINDGEGNDRTITYDYSAPVRLPDDEVTFYTSVTVRNRGGGTGNMGWVTKTYNGGASDLRMVALPLTVTTYNSAGIKVQERVMEWDLHLKNYSNGYLTVGQGYLVRMSKQTDRQFFEGAQMIETASNYSYNSYGLLTSSNRVNSKGQTESTQVSFAYQHFGFLSGRHMLDFPGETTSRLDGEITSVERNVWVLEGDKAYPKENWTQINDQPWRINMASTRVDGFGNIVENENGRGLFNTVLFGYDNLYPVATITNATFTDVTNELDVSYTTLQTLSNNSLKAELSKLYSRLPDAIIEITLYDDNGNITSQIDSREEELKNDYDGFNRLIRTTNSIGNVIQRNIYNYSN